jgi:hypothetical protein
MSFDPQKSGQNIVLPKNFVTEKSFDRKLLENWSFSFD